MVANIDTIIAAGLITTDSNELIKGSSIAQNTTKPKVRPVIMSTEKK